MERDQPRAILNKYKIHQLILTDLKNVYRKRFHLHNVTIVHVVIFLLLPLTTTKLSHQCFSDGRAVCEYNVFLVKVNSLRLVLAQLLQTTECYEFKLVLLKQYVKHHNPSNEYLQNLLSPHRSAQYYRHPIRDGLGPFQPRLRQKYSRFHTGRSWKDS